MLLIEKFGGKTKKRKTALSQTRALEKKTKHLQGEKFVAQDKNRWSCCLFSRAKNDLSNKNTEKEKKKSCQR